MESRINNKRKKRIKILVMAFLIGIFSFLFFSEIVDAGFACGQVVGNGLEPQWMGVKVYESRINFTSCQVSPDENKFCCDAEAIPGFSWVKGKQIYSEIFDNETGYFAKEVSLKISGEGYDVFPTLYLEKAIKVNNWSKVFLSNDSKFLLEANFAEPFTKIWIEKNKTRVELCNSSNYSGNILGDFGMNYLKIVASDGKREFTESLEFAVLRDFKFNRVFACDKCGKFIKRGQNVTMKISLNLSHYVEGMEFKEYIPKEFEIIETDGKVEEYSETHKVISWNVSGKEIVREYKVKAPDVLFFPARYTFKTELGNLPVGEDKIVVSRFFSFLSFDEGIKLREIKRKVYSRIQPEKPLVFEPANGKVVKIAVFPKKLIENVEFDFKEYEGEGIDGDANYYSFESSLEDEDIEKVYLEFRQNKSEGNLSIYVFEEGWEEWDISEPELLREDKKYYYYGIYLPATKKISLVGKEKEAGSFFRIFG